MLDAGEDTLRAAEDTGPTKDDTPERDGPEAVEEDRATVDEGD